MIETGDGGTDLSGKIVLSTGDTSTANSGSIGLRTGPTTTGDSGKIDIYSGSPTGVGGKSGDITVYSGNGDNGGDMWLFTGTNSTAPDNAFYPDGSIYITTSVDEDVFKDFSKDIINQSWPLSSVMTGRVNISTGHVNGEVESGGITIMSGNAGNFNTSTSGEITISTGHSFQDNAFDYFAGKSGNLRLKTGTSGTGDTGDVLLASGDLTKAQATLDTGKAQLYTGSNAGGGDSGIIEVYTGDSTSGGSGSLTMKTGFTPANTKTSGAITIATGGKEDINGDPVNATSNDLGASGALTLRTGNSYNNTGD